MMWVKNAIWWHVYPLGFVGAQIRGDEANGPVLHRFSHLEAWLDYALELGASGIMLGPGQLFLVEPRPTGWLRFNVAFSQDERMWRFLEQRIVLGQQAAE